jgi:hypothetical protein
MFFEAYFMQVFLTWRTNLRHLISPKYSKEYREDKLNLKLIIMQIKGLNL